MMNLPRNIILALCYGLFAAASSFGQVGFYSPKNPNLSPVLRTAAESVFEIRTAFVSDLSSYSDLIVVDISSPSKKAAVLSRLETNKDLDSKEKTILKAFVNRCEKVGEQHACQLPGSINAGSGFLTGDGRNFWTNAHVLEGLINMRVQTRSISRQEVFESKGSLPIFIFDQEGNLIFNGLESEIAFQVLPHETDLARLKSSFYAEDSDYIALRLPTTLGRPLPVARAAAVPGQELAVIGYPYCTGCEPPAGVDADSFFDRGPSLNAADCEEMATLGEALSLADWAQRAMVHPQFTSLLDASTFLGTTTDSQYGMSGGPVLNAKGEVVGIHAGGKTIVRNGNTERYSRGVVPPALFLERSR